MADVYCPKCGEPTDVYEFHDAVVTLGVTYAEATRRFRTEGCEAMPGWRCNPDTDYARAETARVTYAYLGDDMDGAAAVLDTPALQFPPTPTWTPVDPVYQFNMTAADADRMTRMLAAVQPWISPDHARPNIHMIHMEAQTHHHDPVWTMCATDSYGLVRVRTDRPQMNHTTHQLDVQFGIPVEAVKPWIKQLQTKHQTHVLTVETDTGMVTLTTAGTTTTYLTPDPTAFPDIRKVWPDELDEFEPAGLNPERLMRLMKSANAIMPRRDQDSARVAVERLHTHKPSLWTMTHDHIEWCGLLMPMRA